MSRRFSHLLSAIPPLLFLLGMAILPTYRLINEGWQNIDFSILQDPYIQGKLLWSVVQAGATCLLASFIGIPIAWIFARYQFGGRQGILKILMLPFVMPTLVAGIGVLALWGNQGLFGINLQDTPWLLLYGNLFYNLPLLIKSACDGFLQIPTSQIATARTLGASSWRTFWRVEIKQCLPWILSAQSLIFLYCFSGFGLALLLGGMSYSTLEVEIYTRVAYELDLGSASAIAILSLAVCSSIALLYAWIERYLISQTLHASLHLNPPKTLYSKISIFGALACLLFICGAPLIAIIWQTIVNFDQQTLEQLFTAEFNLALYNSTRFTCLALIGVMLIGVLHGIAAAKSLTMRTLTFLPFIISPVCIAFGLLLVYPNYSASLIMLLAAYVLLAYPFLAKNLSNALQNFPRNLIEAAKTLGASPAQVAWRIILPNIAPALRRGLAFAAATTIGEFAITLFLSRPEWLTLSTLIYQYLGRPGELNLEMAHLLSCCLMVFAGLCFVIIEKSPSHARTR